MKNEIIQAVEKEKIIAIIRGVKEEKLSPLVQALYDGGIKLIEVTFGKDSERISVRICKNIFCENAICVFSEAAQVPSFTPKIGILPTLQGSLTVFLVKLPSILGGV